MRGRKPQIGTDRDALPTVPRPPSWLAKEAKAEWRRVMPLLVERRILTDADMGCVEAYCTAIARVREAEKLIAVEGLTMGSRKHPAVALQNDAMTQARQLAAELGLTPVSRSRPAVRDTDHGDDVSDLGL
ncbi:MAG TPA: phage terminase small subunit P27 family [Beijerinckiaceae bacterium]|jgi:P27 family predicted phage terminase small subunit